MKDGNRDYRRSWVDLSERLLFGLLVAISSLVHVLLLTGAIGSWQSRPSPPQELAITVDLVSLPSGKDSADSSAKNMLPQLPKRFRVNPSRVELGGKKKKQPRELEPKVQERLKRVTLDRFRREIHRRATKKAKKTSIRPRDAVTKRLAQRKRELKSRIDPDTITLGTAQGQYAATLRSWILTYYTLPEIFKLKHSSITAEIHMVLNAKGGIRKLELVKSSGNQAFDKLALNTLQTAVPYPPPPKTWIDKTIVLPFEPTLWMQK